MGAWEEWVKGVAELPAPVAARRRSSPPRRRRLSRSLPSPAGVTEGGGEEALEPRTKFSPLPGGTQPASSTRLCLWKVCWGERAVCDPASFGKAGGVRVGPWGRVGEGFGVEGTLVGHAARPPCSQQGHLSLGQGEEAELGGYCCG